MPNSALTHQHWGVEALWQDLEPVLPGLSIEVLARVDSTNTALLERVRSDTRHPGERGGEHGTYGRRSHDMNPCLLVAEHQTHGRGRMGRSWHAQPGASLTFSLAVPMDLADWSGLSLAVGCAIAQGLEPQPGAAPRLQLKWPNDIWLMGDAPGRSQAEPAPLGGEHALARAGGDISGRKLGGILIETVPAGSQRMAIIGIGLNVTRQDLTPQALEGQFSTGFASLDEFEAGLNAPAVLARVARPLVLALKRFAEAGFAPWQAEYASRDLLRGHEVVAGNLEGVAQGVSAQGELLVQTADGLQPVSGGEVSVRLGA